MHTIGIGILAVTFIAGTGSALAQDAKAAEVLAKTRKAIGNVDSLKSLGIQASSQRNVGSTQMSSEVELFVEMPDKYLKREERAA